MLITQDIRQSNNFHKIKKSRFDPYENVTDIQAIIANANIRIIIRQKEVPADMGEYFKS